jgi:hypothetical protein
MKHFNFWQKWLVIVGALYGLMGCYLAVAPTFFHVEFAYINRTFWESAVVPVEAKAFYNWIFGIYSAMAIAWALFIVLIAGHPFKKKEKWAWNCLASCISVWFLIDTFFSVYAGAYTNAINNCFFLALLLLPLFFTRKAFI